MISEKESISLPILSELSAMSLRVLSGRKLLISPMVSGDLEKPSLTIKQADIGSISTKVERGSVYEFTITPEENWLIHSVSFNGNDYTNELTLLLLQK